MRLTISTFGPVDIESHLKIHSHLSCLSASRAYECITGESYFLQMSTICVDVSKWK